MGLLPCERAGLLLRFPMLFDSLMALLSAFITAAYFIYVSRVMKADRDISSAVTLAVGHLVAALALVPLWAAFSVTTTQEMAAPEIVWAFLAASGCLLLSRQLYFFSYARTEVANITVFSALTPVYALGTGYVMLHEVPQPAQLVGMLLICGSIYSLFLKREPHLPLLANIAQPFRAVMHSPAVLCAFLSTIPSAFAAVYQKRLLATVDPLVFTLVLLLLIGVMALACCLAVQSPRRIWAQCRQLPVGFFFVSATLLPAMHVVFCYVMQHHQVALSLVLQRTSILFQIILAYIFLGERQDIGKRIRVGCCILAGFAMIIGGR